MSLNRKQSLLAACTLVFLTVAPAFGQEGLRDMQLFDQADMSTYGGGHRAQQGFFFSFDGLTWWVGKPDIALIGDQGTRRVVITPQNPSYVDGNGDDVLIEGFEPEKVFEFSTHSTGALDSEEVAGQRYNFGFVEEHHGWLCSIFNLSQQAQTIFGTDVHVVFDDALFGDPERSHLSGPIWVQDPPILDDTGGTGIIVVDDLSVRFDELNARYTVKTWGAELSYLYRTHPFRCGGILEWYFGARYLEFDDRFAVDARTFVEDDEDEFLSIPNGLGDCWWENRADNHIVGPQFGFHWFRKTSRWTWSTAGRFFAGFNQQNVKLQGLLGDGLDPATVYAGAFAGEEDVVLKISNMSPTAFNHSRRFHEFSPAAELRVNLTYQLTRSVSLGAGWTALWIDNVARAPGLIDYTLAQDSVMGIGPDNTQDVFAHGVNATVTVNRY